MGLPCDAAWNLLGQKGQDEDSHLWSAIDWAAPTLWGMLPVSSLALLQHQACACPAPCSQLSVQLSRSSSHGQQRINSITDLHDAEHAASA